MSRWAPDTALRLEEAALELFVEKGYAATAIPEIAARAGLTTRTFFRHFPDKREVLFLRDRELPAVVASLLAEAPRSLSPLALVMHCLETVAAGPFPAWRPRIRARRSVIRSDAALRERELLKGDTLSGIIADGLCQIGTDEQEARLVARYAVLVFDLAVAEWLGDGDDDDDGDRGDHGHDVDHRVPSLVDALRRVHARLGELTQPVAQEE